MTIGIHGSFVFEGAPESCRIALVLHHRLYRVQDRYYGDMPNLLDLILALNEQAGKVVLAVPSRRVDTPPGWMAELPRELEVVELPFYSSYFDLLRRSPALLPALVRTVLPRLREWDLVGGVAPSGFGLVVAVLARLRGKPAFLCIRGNVLASLAGEQSHSRARRWLVMGAMWPLDAITRVLIAAGMPAFTFGPALAKRYRGPRVHVLNGYARSSLLGNTCQQLPASEEALQRLLYVGRLTGEKGVDVLLRALNIVVQTHSQVHLKIIGDGIERDTLLALVDELELQQHVTFVRYVHDPTRLRELYLDAGIVVLPSRTEGVPAVALEAMAFGRAVVATRVGGLPSVIKDRETGLLVPPDDPAALASAIERLISNPDVALHLAAQAAGQHGAHDADSEAADMLRHMLGAPAPTPG
ncbi:MAG: glycosyltransferase [Chloroflexota bacterium]